ncbi:phosphoadenylyl-sulfate reductase [Sphingosinicella terrae]|uniref:phosphoadenylyl-sulfate reductase n=1 Tax=Sphingosinicella terrae TaxID=2172047 RepID=UPI000E0DC6E3|nr:phosphoadenylyl-sulfate reductase [Sphingosinicella terrae]
MSTAALPRIAGATPAERLIALREAVAGRIVFTTSFGIEDQAITHVAAGLGLDIDIVTLDTGRLFPSTYDLWKETEARYGLSIRGFAPDPAAVEAYVQRNGRDGFYESKDARIACCNIRKVEPLGRALAAAAAWVTGLRADQSTAREAVPVASWDLDHELLKVAPLFDWSRDRVAEFVEAEGVPVNPLHARGYPSIGCEPCTRATRPGEAERAGRWWWENDNQRECGLHVDSSGRLVRAA